MTHQPSATHAPAAVKAGQQVAQLRHLLALVQQLSGATLPPSSDEAMLDENARISSAYDSAPAIVRRRFDTLAEETGAWATIGVEALLAADDGDSPARAAAIRLGDELATALKRLTGLLSIRA